MRYTAVGQNLPLHTCSSCLTSQNIASHFCFSQPEHSGEYFPEKGNSTDMYTDILVKLASVATVGFENEQGSMRVSEEQIIPYKVADEQLCGTVVPSGF